MTDPVIRVSQVSKQFNIRRDKSLKERLVNSRRSKEHAEEFWALRDVSFDVMPATALGLVGHNGSGKSTLLKTIGGIIAPTEGTVERRGRLAALLELGAGFHPDLTGRENVYLNASILGLSRAQTERYFDDIVAFSGIPEFVDTQVKFYSSGMYVRLAFAVAVHVDPEVLLIDEVLAVGDEPFQRKCLDRVRRFRREGRTIVLVTHSLETVAELCDRAIVLERGRVMADGLPRDALPVLREAFAAEERGELAETAARVRIDGLRVLQRDGRPASRLPTGSPLVIELDLDREGPVPDVSVGLSIHNHSDVAIVALDTSRHGLTLDESSGRAVLRFSVEALPLVDDQYFVSANVRVGDQVVQRLERGASFVVVGAPIAGGLIDVGARINIAPAETSAILR